MNESSAAWTVPTLHGVRATPRAAVPAEQALASLPNGDALSLIGIAYGTQSRAETTPVETTQTVEPTTDEASDE